MKQVMSGCNKPKADRNNSRLWQHNTFHFHLDLTVFTWIYHTELDGTDIFDLSRFLQNIMNAISKTSLARAEGQCRWDASHLEMYTVCNYNFLQATLHCSIDDKVISFSFIILLWIHLLREHGSLIWQGNIIFRGKHRDIKYYICEVFNLSIGLLATFREKFHNIQIVIKKALPRHQFTFCFTNWIKNCSSVIEYSYNCIRQVVTFQEERRQRKQTNTSGGGFICRNGILLLCINKPKWVINEKLNLIARYPTSWWIKIGLNLCFDAPWDERNRGKEAVTNIFLWKPLDPAKK